MRAMKWCLSAKAPRTVLIIAVAGLAAGCSNSASRLATAQLFSGNNSPFTPQPDVVQRDLAPMQTSALGYANAAPPPATAASLRSRGWSVENAPVVEVTGADTAVTLSQGYGVPVAVILEANGLSRADEVRPGQRLLIPTYERRDDPPPTSPTTVAAGPGAPPTTLNEQAGMSSGGAGEATSHRVAAGETLWSISRRYGVAPHEMIALNDLPADGTVRFGDTLRLPSGASGGGTERVQVAALSPQPSAQEVATDAAPEPVATAPAASTPEPAQPTETASAPAASEATAPGFRWPVKGRLISGFGKQADGARNDGINLAVPAGTPVRAAESGTVIYAGDELEGYGNLVLVQHEDDWVSAYAHNSTLKVNRGDKVERGQPIAAAGDTGSVDQPQVHFELRKRSKPIDPLPHLAG